MVIVTVQQHLEPHDESLPKTAAIVFETLRKEGSFCGDEIAWCYGFVFGEEQPGTRIVNATDLTLRRLTDDRSSILVEAGSG